ncbi:hypothetical protein QBC40DRAFT_302301 [Triangularia verruculosa]|uniref:Uncharacterized protein n=1 Tax=Triangularia verruculosa TaxID=2587418 RepID=A0AAN6X7E1_9PEZI|nr:hypothetical protein QBC40DRAFT_302301 [Triangularia verruculosa]
MSFGYHGHDDGMRTRQEDHDDDFSPSMNAYRSPGGNSSASTVPLTLSYQSRDFEFDAPTETKARKGPKSTWETTSKGAPFMTGGRAESYVADTPEQRFQYTQFNQMASNDIYTKDGAIAAPFQQEEYIGSKAPEDYRVIAAGSKYIDYAPGNSTRHPPTAYSGTTPRRPGYSYPSAPVSNGKGKQITLAYSGGTMSFHKLSGGKRRGKGKQVAAVAQYGTPLIYQEQPAAVPGYPDPSYPDPDYPGPSYPDPSYPDQSVPAYDDSTVYQEPVGYEAEEPIVDLPQEAQYAPTEWENSAYSMERHHRD